MKIPLNNPYLTGNELKYMKKSMESGELVGGGEYTHKCEDLLEREFGAKKVLLTSSCTHALEMASLLVGLGSGDEVIVPSYTFVSTVNAFVLQGAEPVFVDMREDTLNMDESKVEEKISKNTKAIFPMHYSGVACAMDEIIDIADRHGLRVVEDAAQGVNAKYRDEYLGTIGDLGTYSFHGTKNYTCGEGGALVINEDGFIERAEIVREKGTNRSKFLRGEIDKYTWVDIGSSYLASELTAAFLYAQLEELEKIKKKREKTFGFYHDNLKDLEEEGKLRRPVVPEDCEVNYYSYFVLLPSEKKRNSVMEKLKNSGIQATFHYIPLHTSPMGAKFGYKKGDLPTTEKVSNRLLRLPFYTEIEKEKQKKVIEELERCV
ncbi:TDP-4-oxo-6-deoxy-D-glucose aminotransferase [candidate division MSBL1 archaeon SCGC-AAA385D11]|uniref:TDP-4-oxo-6-deoxy-D-glucose aminotransferase n=1 Tax=candidate division MSBL1 archaeon SCGC-AAA385D11 TaxID=1698286 RepID=A0A133VN62_9EURY|nr:TDP-4-oxo-6-deoxy-D-glucose aminotransferase [candidate division MSBL1 archaeon SCGC-AAA385D11]